MRRAPFRYAALIVASSALVGSGCASAVTPVGVADAGGDSASGPSAIRDLAAGSSHTCGVTDRGGVTCWGANSDGQLGDGTTMERTTPVAAVGIADAVQVVAGWSFTCVRHASGSVSCWGTGSGQPVEIAGLANVVDLAAGSEHVCARTSLGETWCWGRDAEGQLGDGMMVQFRTTPVATSYGANAVEITGGSEHTCAREASGVVDCWGANFVGELGNGTMTPVPGAARVEGLDDAVEIRSSAYTTCSRRATGSIVCWGVGLEGELGDGSAVASNPHPVTVVSLSDATSLSVGFRHSCATRSSGAVVCWGDNRAGQLGDGTTVERAAPVAAMAVADAVRVVAGGEHTCAVRRSGELLCWGDNSVRQLGDGTTISRSRPTLVNGL